MNTTTTTDKGVTMNNTADRVTCDHCGDTHAAEPSHKSQFDGGQVYVVVCPADHLTDYYTADALLPVSA